MTPQQIKDEVEKGERLKIYLLEQSEASGYDTYDSIIVIAKNEEDAKLISPYGRELRETTGDYDSWVGKDNIDKIKVTYLGEYLGEEREDKVILASFNAG